MIFQHFSSVKIHKWKSHHHTHSHLPNQITWPILHNKTSHKNTGDSSTTPFRYVKHNSYMKSARFWDITQRWVIVLHRRFGTIYLYHLQGSKPPKRKPRRKISSRTSWTLKMTPIGCPETSVYNYHSKLRNIPEEWRSHVHRGGSLRSLTNCRL
jgi:hypothetical protein